MIEKTERRAGRVLTWFAFILVALAVLIFSMAVGAVFAKEAHAHPSEQLPPPVTTTVTKADLAPQMLALDVKTAALRGEGVIRITTRVCGNASNWQAVAAANSIVPTSNPPYLVLLGQVLTVACAPGTVPAPAPAPAPVTRATSGWVNPLPGACLGSPWNQKRVNSEGEVYYHEGWDLPAGHGATIRAAAAGTVVVAGWSGGGGNTVVIEHAEAGVWTVYMHQSRIATWKGAWVYAGQTIGYVGNTGNSFGDHLHFEVNEDGPWGDDINPVTFLANRGVRLGC